MKDKIYYCNITGQVLLVLASLVNVKDYTFEEHYQMYSVLNERVKETIGLIELEFGEFEKVSKNSTNMSVNLETGKLEFTYDEIPREPNRIDILENKISILESENTNLKVEQTQQNDEILVNMLANTEMFEMILSMMPSTYSIKNNKNNGGISMIEVYATLIIKGVKTIDDVPVVIRAQVEERLRQLEVPVK